MKNMSNRALGRAIWAIIIIVILLVAIAGAVYTYEASKPTQQISITTTSLAASQGTSITFTLLHLATGKTNFMSQPMVLAVIVLVIIIAIVAVLVATRRKTQLRQPGLSNQNSSIQNTSQPVMSKSPKTVTPATETTTASSHEPDAKEVKLTFCPNCGNKLLNTKRFCPFCGSDLSQWHTNAKK